MSHIEEIPCIEVLSSVVFIIEGVVEEARNPQAIESHLNSCLACRGRRDSHSGRRARAQAQRAKELGV